MRQSPWRVVRADVSFLSNPKGALRTLTSFLLPPGAVGGIRCTGFFSILLTGRVMKFFPYESRLTRPTHDFHGAIADPGCGAGRGPPSDQKKPGGIWRGRFLARHPAETGNVEFLHSLGGPTRVYTRLCIAVRHPVSPPRHDEATDHCGGPLDNVTKLSTATRVFRVTELCTRTGPGIDGLWSNWTSFLELEATGTSFL